MTNQLAIREDMSLSDIGTAFVKSGYFTDVRDVSQAIVKIMAGREFGFGPFASMTNIYIIQGRPSLGANLMASAVKSNAHYDYRVRQMTDAVCEIEYFQRNGDKWESLGVSKFTQEDARKAGTKNLDKFPRNMLFARAMSNGVRWYCPDVFGTAVYTPEEMGANVNEEGDVIPGEWIPEPTPQPETPKVTVTPAPAPAHPKPNGGYNPVTLLVENGLAENNFEAVTILNKYAPTTVKGNAEALLSWTRLYRTWRDAGSDQTKAAQNATEGVPFED
jgi:hypothetical protein